MIALDKILFKSANLLLCMIVVTCTRNSMTQLLPHSGLSPNLMLLCSCNTHLFTIKTFWKLAFSHTVCWTDLIRTQVRQCDINSGADSYIIAQKLNIF